MQTERKRKTRKFHCRLKALGTKCRMETAEHDLIKDVFVAFMSNADIQQELVMETRTPIQVLQFALNRERGQQNQRAINAQLNRHPLLPPNQISYIQRNQPPTQKPRQRIPIRNPQQQRNVTPSNPC